MNLRSTTMTVLLALAVASPCLGQYTVEFVNYSERDVEIALVSDVGQAVYLFQGESRVTVAAGSQYKTGFPNNAFYYLHVTPLDGLTATKVIEIRTGPCCPTVERVITYAVDSGDFPSLAVDTPPEIGGAAQSENNPFLGDWVCGAGTMTISSEGGGIAGTGDQGWGPRLRNGGTITDLRVSGGTATMDVAYGDGTIGTFQFVNLTADGQAMEVGWTWSGRPSQGGFRCRRPTRG